MVATTQFAMLERCAALLAPRGLLVYATCSILPQENQEVVERFLRRHGHWRRTRPDLQLLPRPRAAGAAQLTDGFYYACLTREDDAA